MKKYYSEVVKYWMRFYINNLDKPTFNTKKAESNWNLCNEILKTYNGTQQAFFVEVYKADRSIEQVIRMFSSKHAVKQSVLWKWLDDVEQEFAENKLI